MPKSLTHSDPYLARQDDNTVMNRGLHVAAVLQCVKILASDSESR